MLVYDNSYALLNLMSPVEGDVLINGELFNIEWLSGLVENVNFELSTDGGETFTTLADYIKLRRFSYIPGLVNYKHLPDMVRAVPVGDGFIDQEAFFKGLKDGGFDGYVAYEMCSPLRGGGSEENLDMTAKKSQEKIEELIR